MSYTPNPDGIFRSIRPPSFNPLSTGIFWRQVAIFNFFSFLICITQIPEFYENHEFFKKIIIFKYIEASKVNTILFYRVEVEIYKNNNNYFI